MDLGKGRGREGRKEKEMSYPKKVGLETKQIIGPHQEKITSLRDGESLLFSGTQKELDILRSHLYVWLATQGLKAYFKVMREGGRLRLFRKIFPNVQVEKDRGEGLGFVEGFVLDELLECGTEEEAQQIVKERTLEGKLRFDQAEQVLAEWKRKCS